MKLDFITHDKLTVAKVNMRAKGRGNRCSSGTSATT